MSRLTIHHLGIIAAKNVVENLVKNIDMKKMFQCPYEDISCDQYNTATNTLEVRCKDCEHYNDGLYFIKPQNPFILFVSIYRWLFMVGYDPSLTQKQRKRLIFWRVFMVLFVLGMILIPILTGKI